jgi:Fic family protein
LQQVRTAGDWENWLLFFVDAVAATAAQAVETAQQLNQLRANDKTRLAGIGRMSGSTTQLLDVLFNQPIANMGRLAEHTGLSLATVSRALDALEQLNIVKELTGQKRNRIYAYQAYVDILNQD